ncbi:uncharacterized protein LOC135467287 [Liolophura sinensis]|uniref:uncharacterized protein LOC135467287 n=1 Tax=Liolophura sinensis TaxID=3198878 RepID=UPI0031591B33
MPTIWNLPRTMCDKKKFPLNGLVIMFLLLFSLAYTSNGHGIHNAGEEKGIGDVAVWEQSTTGVALKPWHISRKLCRNVTVTKSSAEVFLNRLHYRHVNFGFIHVYPENKSELSFTKTPDVLFRTVWVWTLLGEGGAFPYLWYSLDFYSLSFGILDKYTDHYLRLNLTTDSPTPCMVQVGGNSTQIIANAFNAVMETSYGKTPKNKRSVFCYSVRYKSYGPFLYYVTHLLGIEKGYTGYKCCYQRQDPSNKNKTVSNCSDKIQPMTKWYCVLYTLVFLGFFFCPVVVSWVAHRLAVPDGDTNLPSLQNYQPLSSEDIQEDSNQNEVLEQKWIFLGVDKPITLLKVFCKLFRPFRTSPVLASRLQRLVAILLTPSVICFMIFMKVKDGTQERWVRYRLDYDIPVGFMAIPFGFKWNLKNWGYLFGGPYVMYSLYFSLGLVMLLLPRDFSKIMTKYLKCKSEVMYTLLSIDVLTMEKWSSTTFSHLTGYHFIHDKVTANFYMLMNRKFWRFTKDLFVKRFILVNDRLKRLFSDECAVKCSLPVAQFVLFVWYAVFCVLELLCAFVYYGLPSVYLAVTILRGYNVWLKDVVPHLGLRAILHFIISVLVIHNLIAFAILFICSGIYITSAIDFTYIGLIIYPEYTTGYIIAAGTLAYYLIGNIRKFNDIFSELLDLTVNASMNLESQRNKGVCKVTENTIVISPHDATVVETIKVQGEVEISLSDNQKSNLKHCGLHGSLRKLVKWRDNQPGIPYELFIHVMNRYCPLHKHVFWFLLRLAVFCLVVVSITTLLASYNIKQNLAIPAQVITAVTLNILPRVMEAFVSKLDIRLAHEHWKRCIETAVESYWISKGLVRIV